MFKKINKFPNNNDLVEIQTLLLRIKDRFVKKLSEYFSNPFSENFSKSVVEATTYTFSEELKQYISLALAPLYRLNAEGKGLMTMNTREEIPVEIKESLARFQKDYPDQSKTAFIMMRFADTKTHNEIASAIKDILSKNDIKGLRADDKQYHTDLLPNILTYVYGCKFGIAVFERIEADDFNPNVAFELGYMFALRKDVCLLKDKTLNFLQTDIIAKQYKNFDTRDIEKTVSQELTKWLEDIVIIKE